MLDSMNAIRGPVRGKIRVDGVEIAEEALSLEAQLQDAPDPTAAWESAARALVVRQLAAPALRLWPAAARPSTYSFS